MPTDLQDAACGGAGRARLAGLYAQCRPRMLRAARAILQNPQDAEDAVQNAFCQLLRRADRLGAIPEDELPFWVTAVVRNEALSLLRRRRDTVPLEERDGAVPDADDAASYAELVSLIRQLPAPYRAAMEQKLLAGATDAEIAESLGISKTAASTRLCRGRALLKKLLRASLSAVLVLLLGLGVLLAVSPRARAAAVRFVAELYERYIVYRYTQAPGLDALPVCGVTAPPAGFSEVWRHGSGSHVMVFYTDGTDGFLCLEYFLLKENAVSLFPSEGRSPTPLSVGGMPGEFWENDILHRNLLTWTDMGRGIRFGLIGSWSREEMLHMAESVSLSEPTK